MNVRLPKTKGMGGSQQDMLRQVQKMQEDMANLQEELEAREYEVSAGGGMVTVRINGKKEILSMDIQPEVVDPDDTETLADVVVAAVNEAMRLAETEAANNMSRLTGGLNLGGLF